MMLRATVVIPCYNQGSYLMEALASVGAQTLSDVEVVVVDDGSTDVDTIRIISEISQPRTTVIRTRNQGLAAARNTGIAVARTPYILPLDADDLIGERYIEQAARVLDEDEGVGIVYCNGEKFGAATGRLDLPDFIPGRICRVNPIFCSAMFRRRDWELAGGYKKTMKYGWEDWEFWLSILELGRSVVRLPDCLFYYRVREDSMTRTMAYWQKVLMMTHMVMSHPRFYLKHILRGSLR